VVRNHAGGTREGVATLSEGRESVREWTLRLSSMEGRSLDNPKRGNPVLPSIGSQGPGRDGKAGTKVRRVARFTMKVVESGPIEGPSRARARKRPRPWRAVVKANRTMTSIGSSPRGRHPVDVAAGRGPSSGARSARSGFARSDARHLDVVAGGFGRTPVCPVVRGRRLRLGMDVPSGASGSGRGRPCRPREPLPVRRIRPMRSRKAPPTSPMRPRGYRGNTVCVATLPAGDSGGCTEPSANL
jgi:hypothetical protein